MTISDWPDSPSAQVIQLREELDAVTNHNEILTESMADIELRAEDAGWIRLTGEMAHALTRRGIGQIASNCRVMAVASPLIKRGLLLRAAYVWGQGVQIAARDEDVNTVIQGFLDDPSNVASFTGSQAREELELALGHDGNLGLALFTSPLTGRVQVRSTPFEEIQDVVHNPEDRDEPWLYLRQYEARVIEAGTIPGTTRTRKVTRRTYHPALGFWPATRPKSVDGIPVQWDAPMLHVSVNRLDGTTWGIPDAFAAINFARGYEGFLTDWARLVKALSRFAWRLSGDKSSRARTAAEKIRSTLGEVPPVGSSTPVGGVAASGPGLSLEAIPKSGATIDSGSGRPLAAAAAAALGVPVTMLLADPGVTGARATAETLDKPTILEAGMRRALWASVIDRILEYVIVQAVKAPRGPLSGSIGRDEAGREVYTLAGDADATIDIDWPKLDDLDPKSLIEAIAKADETRKMPPPVTAKLLLQALGVKDVDDILEAYLDDEGRWIDPDITAGQAAVEAYRRGEDPAGIV